MTSIDNPSSELQALLDAAVDAVITIDSSGRIQVFNHTAERLFGYASLEVLGQNVNILMTDKDRQQHDAYLERYQRTGVPHIIGIGRRVAARRKDGTVFQAFLSVARVANANPPRYVGFVQDLTLRLQALREVLRERDRANRYLEAVQTILVALDRRGRVTLINRRGCEILGCDESALFDSDWFETVVPPEERASAVAQWEAFLSQQTHRSDNVEYHVRGVGGATRLIAWRYVMVEDTGGGVSGILCSGDDVTDSRRAEAEARDARERMMHVSRLATMGEMATGISHELNQPLAAITIYAQTAKRLLAAASPQIDDVGEALEQIANQALRAGEIIRHLRRLVRKHAAHREPTRVNDLIEELGTLTRADARANDVRVTLALAADLPLISLDAIQIQQVVLNLVSNAVQAFENSAIKDREILISTNLSEDGGVEIKVQDTGPGVSAEMLPRLFLPFATSKRDGTGLGLAISRGIMQAHKGRLEYSANNPSGACFIVSLPIG
jgi:two-component system sensor kinase FixL